jgi:hypothetical protein
MDATKDQIEEKPNSELSPKIQADGRTATQKKEPRMGTGTI